MCVDCRLLMGEPEGHLVIDNDHQHCDSTLLHCKVYLTRKSLYEYQRVLFSFMVAFAQYICGFFSCFSWTVYSPEYILRPFLVRLKCIPLYLFFLLFKNLLPFSLSTMPHFDLLQQRLEIYQRKHNVLFGRHLEYFSIPEKVDQHETIKERNHRVSNNPSVEQYAGQIIDTSTFNDELFTLLRNAKTGPWAGSTPCNITRERFQIDGLPRRKVICRPSASRLAKNANVRLLSLPNDVLSIIIGQLDLRAVGRFAAACSASLYAVRNYTPLKHLWEHAGWALRSLIINGTIEKFGLGYMYSVLCSKMCVSCQEPDTMATHVFLPTFERCCTRCLYINPDFRLIRIAAAENVFNLSWLDMCRHDRDISLIPIDPQSARNNMLFAEYRRRRFIPPNTSVHTYTSVRQVRERCLEVHGKRKDGYRFRKYKKRRSPEAEFCNFVFGKKSGSYWNTHRKNYKHTGKPQPFVRTGLISTQTIEHNVITGATTDIHYNMVREALPTDVLNLERNHSVPLPWLCRSKTGSGHQVHNGHYCVSCSSRLPAKVKATLSSALPYCAFYTINQFLNHAKTCPHVAQGAKQDAGETGKTKLRDLTYLRGGVSTSIKLQIQQLDKDRSVLIAEKKQRIVEARAKRPSEQVEKDNKAFMEASRQMPEIEKAEALLADAMAAASIEDADEEEFKQSIVQRERPFHPQNVKIKSDGINWEGVMISIRKLLRLLGYVKRRSGEGDGRTKMTWM